MALKKSPPKIEFPCSNYPIKVIGENVSEYELEIGIIVKQYVPDINLNKVTCNDSKNGRFRSITFYITATDTEQLTLLHQSLMRHANVKMVL
jgi:putative lipoic acid-binding regulatory protein